MATSLPWLPTSMCCFYPQATFVFCVSGLTLGVPSDQLLYLGRQDYVVRSVRMDTKAETWNATFSKLYMIPAGVSGSVKDFLQEGHTAASTAAAAGGWVGTAALLLACRCFLVWACCIVF